MTAWWPFGAKPFLEPEDEAWQIETWAWLLRRLGGRADPGRAHKSLTGRPALLAGLA